MQNDGARDRQFGAWLIRGDARLVGADSPDVALGITSRVLVTPESRFSWRNQDLRSGRSRSLEVGVDLGSTFCYDTDRCWTCEPGIVVRRLSDEHHAGAPVQLRVPDRSIRP